VIGIPIAALVANAVEWTVHKHLLHGLGKNRESMWAYHWYQHHRNSRQSGHVDADFNTSLLEWSAGTREMLTLTAIAVAHLPLLPIAPFYTGAVFFFAGEYAYKHRRAHQDPEWAKQHIPWHYDHHMGPNQDANYCITRPWMDHLMGTREPYLGTEKETRHKQRRARQQKKRAAL